LTNQFNGKSTGGYRLTYTTLSAIIKYPCESVAINNHAINRKKFGFFQSELNTAKEILSNLNVNKENDDPLVFSRHPFVYLTEAADDICYRIIDFEDAHRLHILEHSHVVDTFINLLKEINTTESSNAIKTLKSITDKNEQISYLRAKCINVLAIKSAEEFALNGELILHGKFNMGLIDLLEKKYATLKTISDESNQKIYNHVSVVQLELLGYKVMSDLLSLFIPAVLAERPEHKEMKILKLLPEQFHSELNSPYHKVLSVLDYLSGMTDPFIIELYRKLFGIEIPRHTNN
jgi:dGTPase